MIGRYQVYPVLRDCFYIWRYDPRYPEGERYWLDRFRTVRVRT